MRWIGSIEDLERLGHGRVASRCWSRCDPQLSRRGNIDHAVWRDLAFGGARHERHTFASRKSLRVDYAKRGVAAIANVNNTVANAGRGWSNCYFSSASLDFAGLKSGHLRHRIRFFVDDIHAAGITGRHP